MPIRKNTKKGIQARLKRALASIDARSSEFPNIPRSGYELKQQDAWVKKNRSSFFNPKRGWSTAGVNKMINYGENQYDKRRQQLVNTANRMIQALNNG